MGLYFRKSKSIGPFRINFSKSGIGVSAGVKGARISKGPRGTTVYAGRDGVYYRKTIGKKKKGASKKRSNKGAVSLHSSYQNAASVSNNLLSTLNGNEKNQIRSHLTPEYSRTSYNADNSFAFYPGTDSLTANAIEDNLISSFHSLKTVRLVLVILAILCLVLACFTKLTFSVAGVLFVVLLMVRAILKVDLEYDLSEKEEIEWNNVLVELCKIKDSQKSGLIIADNNLYSKQDILQFSQLGILTAGKSNAYKIRCNVDAFQFVCDGASVYLLPNCIYLVCNKDIKLYSNEFIDIEKANIRVYEHGTGYASDAFDISISWLYETKDGSPDMRYKDNPMSATATYGLISLSTQNNMEVSIAISKKGVADSILNALVNYKDNCFLQHQVQRKDYPAEEIIESDGSKETAIQFNDGKVDNGTETAKLFSNNPLINDLKQNLNFEDGEESYE